MPASWMVGMVLTMPADSGYYPTVHSRDLVRELKRAGWYEDRVVVVITFLSIHKDEVIYPVPHLKGFGHRVGQQNA